MTEQKSLKVQPHVHERMMTLRGKYSVNGFLEILLDMYEKNKKVSRK